MESVFGLGSKLGGLRLASSPLQIQGSSLVALEKFAVENSMSKIIEQFTMDEWNTPPLAPHLIYLDLTADEYSERFKSLSREIYYDDLGTVEDTLVKIEGNRFVVQFRPTLDECKDCWVLSDLDSTNMLAAKLFIEAFYIPEGRYQVNLT